MIKMNFRIISGKTLKFFLATVSLSVFISGISGLTAAENRATEFKISVPAKPSTETVVVDTKFYRVTLSSTGGMVTRFVHKDPQNPLKPEVELVHEYPFFFNVYGGADSSQKFLQATYSLKTQESGNFISAIAELNATILSSSEKDKTGTPVKIRKIYRFHKNLHYWEFKWEVENTGKQPFSLEKLYFLPLNQIGPPPASEGSSALAAFKIFYYTGDSFESETNIVKGGGTFSCGGGSIEPKDEIVEGNVEYFGMSSRFMLMAVQPRFKSPRMYDITRSLRELQLELPGLILKPGEVKSYDFVLYTGPKVNSYTELTPSDKTENPVLNEIHSEIYKAFDFGFTAPIRDLIVSILELLYKIVPNYGVGIILFAVLFKLMFFPLNQAQARSMKKMQELQPKIQELNQKYKNNAQERQRKTIELYRTHKANPLGGCLPMVIQIPIFIALYSAFSDSYELWGSAFIPGWVDDLSMPDVMLTLPDSLPYASGFVIHALPLIMVLSQFLQTKYTMVSGDEMQKKMMLFLPFLMLFFFWSMPSGVVLYWIVFNIFSVVQQLLTKTKAKSAAKA